jgi:ligand-binding sensor domain-containing protein
VAKLAKRPIWAVLLTLCLMWLVVIPGQQAVLACNAQDDFGAPLMQADHPAASAARFDRISMVDGLPDDVVYAILQDRQGFMWFGTGNGLARYDGYQFNVYQSDPRDPASLAHDRVYTLCETRDGELWVGTQGGLDRFEPTTGSFAHYLRGFAIPALHQDEAGILWVGTSSGLTHLDPTNPEPAVIVSGTSWNDPNRPSGSLILAIAQDRMGEMWLGTATGTFDVGEGLDRFDRSTGTFVHYRHDPDDPASLSSGYVRAIAEDHKGELWVGTGGGLSRMDPSSEAFARYQHDPADPSSLANDNVLAVLEDSAGRLWVGTEDGLDQFDRGQNQFIHYRYDRSDIKSLSGNAILALYEDRSGVVWVGTEAGLSRFDETASQFALYSSRPESAYRLSDDTIRAVCEDRNGDLWIGTVEGGLNRLDRSAATVTVYRHDPAEPASVMASAPCTKIA